MRGMDRTGWVVTDSYGCACDTTSDGPAYPAHRHRTFRGAVACLRRVMQGEELREGWKDAIFWRSEEGGLFYDRAEQV